MRDENRPLIGVVTPVKNGEKYLAEAIDSIRSQTFERWEYIIVDGCSDDGSLEIARKYAAKDNRITIISEPDKGLYDALFKGFERSTAPVCCWLNSDDKYMPWAFDLALKYMEVTKASWITGVPGFYDENGLLSHILGPFWYPQTFIRMGLFHGRCLGFIQQESTFFTRELLNKSDKTVIEKIRNMKYAGDFFLWREFARHSSLESLPTVISGFRRHADNLSKDMGKYFSEISSAGCVIPPSLVGKIMKTFFVPISLLTAFIKASQWRSMMYLK